MLSCSSIEHLDTHETDSNEKFSGRAKRIIEILLQRDFPKTP